MPQNDVYAAKSSEERRLRAQLLESIMVVVMSAPEEKRPAVLEVFRPRLVEIGLANAVDEIAADLLADVALGPESADIEWGLE